MKASLYLIIAVLTIFSSNVFAQIAPDDDSDTQQWNEIQLTVPMEKKLDFLAQLQTRVTQNISKFSDNRLQFGFNYKPGKSWSINPFYLYVNYRDSRGIFRTEHRFNLRVGYKLPIKAVGVTLRGLAEHRQRPPRNSWRFRPSVLLEKDLPEKTKLKVFVSEEPFYDSIAKKFSRNRTTLGINRTLNKHLSLDIWFMRQNDGFTRQGNWNVIGTTWRIKI